MNRIFMPWVSVSKMDTSQQRWPEMQSVNIFKHCTKHSHFDLSDGALVNQVLARVSKLPPGSWASGKW